MTLAINLELLPIFICPSIIHPGPIYTFSPIFTPSPIKQSAPTNAEFDIIAFFEIEALASMLGSKVGSGLSKATILEKIICGSSVNKASTGQCFRSDGFMTTADAAVDSNCLR